MANNEFCVSGRDDPRVDRLYELAASVDGRPLRQDAEWRSVVEETARLLGGLYRELRPHAPPSQGQTLADSNRGRGPALSPEGAAEARRLHEEGLDDTEIAERMGIGPWTARRVVARVRPYDRF